MIDNFRKNRAVEKEKEKANDRDRGKGRYDGNGQKSEQNVD